MQVLQIVEKIKPNTIPWFFNLVSSAKNTNHYITSFFGMDETSYKERFNIIKHPYQQNLENNSLITRINNRLISKRRSHNFPRFVKNKLPEVQLVHGHFAHVGYECIPIKQKNNLPLVVSFYGYDYEAIPFQSPEWNNKYKELFAIADLVIAEGKAGASKLLQMGCEQNKIRVLHLGVDVSTIPFHSRVKKQQELKLIQIAAWREKKGQAYTVDAFIQAFETCPNMTLTLVGEGNDEVINAQKEKLKRVGLLSKVTFVPRMEYSQLYEYVKDFQVFIHPSCYASNMDCEGGAPIVLLDVQATGMPVISTTHCDIPDEVISGKTGLLTPEKDVKGLADSIKFFYNMDQNKYNEFAVAGREHVKSEYNTSDTGTNLEKIYASI